jgi:hypothetical protein
VNDPKDGTVADSVIHQPVIPTLSEAVIERLVNVRVELEAGTPVNDDKAGSWSSIVQFLTVTTGDTLLAPSFNHANSVLVPKEPVVYVQSLLLKDCVGVTAFHPKSDDNGGVADSVINHPVTPVPPALSLPTMVMPVTVMLVLYVGAEKALIVGRTASTNVIVQDAEALRDTLSEVSLTHAYNVLAPDDAATYEVGGDCRVIAAADGGLEFSFIR